MEFITNYGWLWFLGWLVVIVFMISAPIKVYMEQHKRVKSTVTYLVIAPLFWLMILALVPSSTLRYIANSWWIWLFAWLLCMKIYGTEYVERYFEPREQNGLAVLTIAFQLLFGASLILILINLLFDLI